MGPGQLGFAGPGGPQLITGPPSAPPGAGWNTAEPLKSGPSGPPTLSGYIPPMPTVGGAYPKLGGPGFDFEQAARDRERSMAHADAKNRRHKQFQEQLKRWKEEGGGPFAASPPGGGGGLGGLGGLGRQQQLTPSPQQQMQERLAAMQQQAQQSITPEMESRYTALQAQMQKEREAQRANPAIGQTLRTPEDEKLLQTFQTARGPSPSPGMTQGPGLMAQQAATPGAQYYRPTQIPPEYQAPTPQEDYTAPREYDRYGRPTQMRERQEFLAPELRDPYEKLTKRIMEVGTSPYEQYQGPRLAGDTAEQAAARAAMAQYGLGEGPMGTRQAESMLGEVGRGIGSMTGRAEAGALDPYMSQYMEGVVDPQLSKLQEFSRQQGEELKSRAAGATGGVGGLREGVVRRGQLQDVRQQAADIIGQGQQRAFESAQRAFGQAHAERLGQLGAASGVAGQYRQLGGQQAGEQERRLQSVLQSQLPVQQQQQAALDVAHQQFLEEKREEQAKPSWMAQQLATLPYASTVQSRLYEEKGSPFMEGVAKVGSAVSAVQQYRAEEERRKSMAAWRQKVEAEQAAEAEREAARVAARNRRWPTPPIISTNPYRPIQTTPIPVPGSTIPRVPGT